MISQGEFELNPVQQEILCQLARALSEEHKDYVSLMLQVNAHRFDRGTLGVETQVDLEWRFYTPSTGHTCACRLLKDAREQFAALNSNTEKMLQGALELEAKAHLIRKR